jgi:pyruvate kinase
MDTYNRLSLLWGITPMFIANIENAGRLVEASERLLLAKNAIQKGDLVVLVIGMGLKAGSTNMIKLHRVGHED